MEQPPQHSSRPQFSPELLASQACLEKELRRFRLQA